MPTLRCPHCQDAILSRLELARHLMVVHQVGGVDAANQAATIERDALDDQRAPDPEPTPTTKTEAPTMPRPCGYCYTQGHGQKDCPKRKKNEGETAPRAKKGKKNTRAAAASPTARATNGGDPVAAARAALDALEQELAGLRAFKASLAAAFEIEKK